MKGLIQPPAFQRPSSKLYLGSNQNDLVSGAPVLVTLDTKPAAYIDGIENVATHRITPGRPGFYAIVGSVFFVNVIASKVYHTLIKINGATFIAESVSHAVIVDDVSALCCVPNQYLAATDYIELYAMSEAGVNTVDVYGSEDRTYLAVQRVR